MTKGKKKSNLGISILGQITIKVMDLTYQQATMIFTHRPTVSLRGSLVFGVLSAAQPSVSHNRSNKKVMQDLVLLVTEFS